MGLSAPPAADPTAGGMGGGAMPPPGGAGGGQGVQILQQIQQLLAQLMQTESDPGVQKAAQAMSQLVDPLMQAVGQADQGNMASGISNPTDPSGGMGGMGGGAAGPDLAGGSESSEGGAGPSLSFGGAKKAAMANFKEKGHFSKSGSKGESLQTDKAKNRAKGK